jgi:hypothetical protein
MSKWMDVTTLFLALFCSIIAFVLKILSLLFLHLFRINGMFAHVCILLLWVVSADVTEENVPLHPIQEMSIRRSDRLMARFEQATQEEAAAEARGRGRPFGRGRGRAAPARAPAAGRGRG